MPIVIGRQHVGDIAGTVAHLRSLTAALERFGAGDLPTERELAVAPMLDPYRFGTRSLPCLVGVCDNHPRLDGPLVTTTEVWAFAPELGWARTYSRLYRLGEPWQVRGES